MNYVNNYFKVKNVEINLNYIILKISINVIQLIFYKK